MRKPGIHITIDKFSEIAKELNLRISSAKIREFFALARGNSLDHRNLINSSNRKIREKVERRTRSSIGDANLLSELIYSVRIKLKHRGVTKIKQSDSQWASIKDLVPLINDFCKNNKLSPRKGYIEFIKVGFILMESQSKKPNYNYCAVWFLKQAQKIFDYYDAKKLIFNDDSPQETQEVLNIYNAQVVNMTGIYNDSYAKNPIEYVNFLKARQLADSFNINYQTFIDAQFEALSFCNGIPQIYDLHGPKAKERLLKYLSKNNLSINNTRSFSKSVWKKFKQ